MTTSVDIRTLRVSEIKRDRWLQARITKPELHGSGMVQQPITMNVAERYAKSMKAGVELPPVQVHMIDGIPVLVDGWHRIRAAEILKWATIKAEITHDSTPEAAAQAAALANLNHGLPLKSRAQRHRAFDMFIAQGKGYIEVDARGRRKRKLRSQRGIAELFGVSHQTIGRWLKERHPEVFKLYPAKVVKEEEFKPPTQTTMLEAVKESALETLESFEAAASQVTPGKHRNVIIKRAEGVLTRLKAGARWALPEPDEVDPHEAF